MNYIEEIKNKLQEHFNFNEEYIGLLDVYTLLYFTHGINCRSIHVHDAWSVWQNNIDPTHRSLVPFEDLTREVQELDDQYRDVIVDVYKVMNPDYNSLN